MEKPSVLIVENNRLLNVLLASVMEELGVHPLKAADAGIALQVMAEFPPRAVVLDVDVPDVDAASFWAECRLKGFDGPIVLAGHEVSQLETAYAAGVIDKPFEAEQIRTTLRDVLKLT